MEGKNVLLEEGKLSFFKRHRNEAFFVLAVLMGLLVVVLPLSIEFSEQRILAVVVFMLILFMSEAVPFSVAGLTGCVLFWCVCGLSFSNSFSGFSDNTPWFILGALMIGSMASKTNIPTRVACHLLKKFGTSYPAMLFGLIVLDFALTPIMPSGSARVVVLCTTALGLIDSYGLDRRSNVAKGMVLILTYSATIFGKTMIAGAASIMSRGIIETVGGVELSWGRWFFAFAPVDLITMVAFWYITLKMYPPEIKGFSAKDDDSFIEGKLRDLGPMKPADYRVIVLLVIAMVLWCTDFWHGISAAKVCLAIGLMGFIPGFGILNKDDFSRLNFGVFVFVGAAISMSNLLSKTSILTNASSFLFDWLTPILGNSHLLAGVLYILSNIFHLFLGEETALLGSTLPIVIQWAVNNNLHPETIGMIWTFSAGGKLFMYQSAVLALGYTFGTFTTKDVLKMGAMIILVELVVITLIVPTYWHLVGFDFYF